MEKELSKCTQAPHLNKNKNKIIKQEFFERQKLYSETTKKKKDKLKEDINRKKEKEEEEIKKAKNKLHKKRKKDNNDKDEGEWVNRLYKEDVIKRKDQKKLMDELYTPSFTPHTDLAKKGGQTNKSEVFDRLYNDNKNDKPLTIDTKLLCVTLNDKKSEEIFRNKIFKKQKKKCASVDKDQKNSKNKNKNKKRNKSINNKNNDDEES